MAQNDDEEEKLLRSVALQNATSILLARQRAEEELVRAKEALQLKTQELDRSLAMLRATLESTTDGILVTDGVGQVTGFNDNFIKMWGLPRGVIGTKDHREIMRFVSGFFTSPQKFVARTDEIYATSPPESYDLLELVDGRVFERFSRIQFIELQNVGRVWSLRDVTEQRHAEESLRKQSEWLRVTLASIGDAVITTDVHGRVTFLNHVAEDLTGWKNSEAKDQALETVFRIVNENTRKPVENPAGRALNEGIVVGLANHTILIAKNGAEHSIDDSAAPIRDADGNTVGAVLIFRDISDRRQIEHVLRESEEKFRLLADTIPQLAWVARPDGHIFWYNRRWYEYTGATPDQMQGWGWQSIHDPVELPKVLERWQASIASGQPFEMVFPLRGADGRFRSFLTQVMPLRAQDGRVIQWFGTNTDITEQIELEQALREGQARLRAIFEGSLDGIVMTDDDGRYIDANPSASELFGVTKQELLQRRISDFAERDYPFDTAWQAFRQQKTSQGEFRLLRPDGTVKDLEFSATADVIPGCHLSVLRDVTERKQAEQALRRSEAQQRFLSDVSAALVGSLHHQSILRQVADLTVPALGDFCFFDLLSADDQLERVGWKHVDPAKVDLAEQVRTFVPPMQAEYHPIIKALRTGRPEVVPQVTDHWLRSIAFNAEHHDFLRSLEMSSLLAVPVLVGERRLGVLSFAYSVSGRSHTPDEVQLAAEIARRIALMIENSKLFNQLRIADQKKNEFLAVLAHELRNPLAPITNALQIMQMTERGDGEVAELRDMMERQVQQMVHLVDDLLDVSRITSGKIVLRKQRLDLSEAVTSALETSRPLIEAARHELTVTLPGEPLFVEGDKTRLAQILSNLLTNAAKYTPEGGRIGLNVGRDGQNALIRIQDTGLGIPAEMLPFIFEMFAQVDRNLGRSQGGLGIGLTLVRSLLEMHGGSIEARSDGPGRGAEFIVSLPLSLDDPAQQRVGVSQPAETSAEPKSLQRRILVVDDNEDSAQTLARLLGILGNEVRMAFDGPSALEAAAKFCPHVVLLDIGLPGMSGHDVARRLRQMPEAKNAVLVAQTGWGQNEDKRHSEAAGFNYHLVKPVDTAELRNLLASLPAQAD